mmetsp:Transcript_15301/g.22445  ORF Transcript_15301/g.22445 Transcript_15301/m.22445 type:complete len:101 (-) Transcript_15301:1064-1366(-)
MLACLCKREAGKHTYDLYDKGNMASKEPTEVAQYFIDQVKFPVVKSLWIPQYEKELDHSHVGYVQRESRVVAFCGLPFQVQLAWTYTKNMSITMGPRPFS